MAIKAKTVVTLNAEAECPTHALSNVTVRDLSFNIDEPTARGGTNTGPSPTETALSALIGCTNVIGHKCAKKLDVDIGHLAISVSCEFDRRGVTLEEDIAVPFQCITLNVRANGKASQSEVERVAAEVAKYCPLSKLFRAAGTEIKENWLAA